MPLLLCLKYLGTNLTNFVAWRYASLSLISCKLLIGKKKVIGIHGTKATRTSTVDAGQFISSASSASVTEQDSIAANQHKAYIMGR